MGVQSPLKVVLMMIFIDSLSPQRVTKDDFLSWLRAVNREDWPHVEKGCLWSIFCLKCLNIVSVSYEEILDFPVRLRQGVEQWTSKNSSR